MAARLVLYPRHPQLDLPQDFDQVRSLLLQFRDIEVHTLAKEFSSPDARHVALIAIGAVTTSATMILNALALGARSRPHEARKAFGITGDLQVAAEALEKFTRIAFITQVQFQIENLAANLYRADALAPPPRGYERLVTTVLHHFRYPSPRRGRSVMLVPAHIRNTLHNNGIHDNADFTVQINHFRYSFQRNRRFTHASWGHIVHALRAELRVIERLLLTTDVRRMKFVEDRYAQAVRPTPP